MIRTVTSGRLATLWFENPPVNVLTLDLIVEMDDALARLESDHGLDYLLLRGGGARGFSAGVSVQAHLPAQHETMLKTFHGLLRRLWAGRLVTVAEARGLVLGGGLELALSCDFGVVWPTAVVGQPEIDVGCYPPVSALLLPELVGARRATDLILTGRRLSGVEALRWGLFTRQVEGEADVEAFLAELLSRSPAVMRQARRWLRRSILEGLAEVERAYTQDLVPLPDYTEGLQAFLEKRPPRWT
ncbi:MAG TPA: enoyl-CoA hydratase/isomerase family protein [Candidatus Xenobia bacterium]|jgi:cyclohexa-1,5-dienecarbonyl-CoA hydratase